jgi:hypothetical protein
MVATVFPADFPEIRDQNELDRLIRENPGLDPGYINTAGFFMLKPQRKLIEKMWPVYQPYADPDFLKLMRSKDNFLSRTWEMVVAYALLEMGHKLEVKTSDKGPDSKIVSSDPAIWVEARSCTPGTGADAVPELLYGVAQTLPKDEIVLRFGNAVFTKFRQYESYLSAELVHPN